MIIDLLKPGYYVPLNLNFVQYFWLILANIFLANFEILA